MMRMLCSLGAIVLTALVAGCTQPPAGPPPVPMGQLDVLRPGDTVSVAVFGQEDLKGDQVVDSNGEITVMLAGRLKVAGLTAAEAEAELDHKLAGGVIVNPSSSIIISHHLQVYIVGEVLKPGGYDWANDLRVINAVALAGGYTYRAEKGQLHLIRYNDPSRTEAAVDQTTQVAPGDTIIVPERWF